MANRRGEVGVDKCEVVMEMRVNEVLEKKTDMRKMCY